MERLKTSSNVFIIETVRPALDNPILIQGLPGLGFVGKIAVDFLIDQLKPVKFAEVYSSYITLPDGDVGINVEFDSTFTIPKYELYAYTKNKPHFILLTGDIQPRSWGQYNVARNILDFIESFGCETLVALGGYALRRRSEEIYAVASDPSMIDDLKKKFKVKPARSGMIKGAFGVMLGLGKGRNLKCLGLLGATVSAYPDLKASKNIVQLISKMFELNISFKEMDKKIKDMESRVKIFKDIRKDIPVRGRKEEEVPQGYIS